MSLGWILPLSLFIATQGFAGVDPTDGDGDGYRPRHPTPAAVRKGCSDEFARLSDHSDPVRAVRTSREVYFKCTGQTSPVDALGLNFFNDHFDCGLRAKRACFDLVAFQCDPNRDPVRDERGIPQTVLLCRGKSPGETEACCTPDEYRRERKRCLGDKPGEISYEAEQHADYNDGLYAACCDQFRLTRDCVYDDGGRH